MARVRIHQPAKTATQSGTAKSKAWVLEYEPASPREPDPLMGWASAKDTLNEVHLRFDTLEAAVAFAKKRGLEYTVLPSKPRTIRPKSYADNFRYDRPT